MLSRLIACGAVVAVALSASASLAQQQQPPQAWPPGPGTAPPPPGQPTYQNQLCTRLEAQLASIDRGNAGDPARAEQLRRYEEASAKQQGELDRTVAQTKRAGCEGSGFFLFNALQTQSQQCVDLNRQIANMRANLDRINVDLQRLRGNDVDRGEQRRSVVVALAQNNCGPQYRTAARQAGGFFDQLFGRESGEGEPAPSGDLANPEAQGGSLRTVCVRTCDGYYFPVSYATNASRFAQDEKTCQRMCPAAEVMLFSYPTQGADITQATSINGQPYTSLPNALKYRTEFNPSCSCRRPGQSWADALGKDEAVEPGDVVVTEERAKQMQQQPAQKGQAKSKQPAAPPATASPAPADTPPPAAAETDNSKRGVRAVGPTFISPRTP
ncbi:MAG: DUF2865 domain-containing protein [Alphaproteobacteria bacterium]